MAPPVDSSRPPPRTGRLSTHGSSTPSPHAAVPSPGSRAAWSDETPAPSGLYHDTYAPEATVPVGSMSPVAHWTADQTSSDGTPVVLHPDPPPPRGAPAPSGEPQQFDPLRPPSHPTQGGLPSSRSFLAEAEATVLTAPNGELLQSADAPATLPIGSMSSIAHAPLVATRPSPFDSVIPGPPPPQVQPAQQAPWQPPAAPPQPMHHTLSTALPPRHAAPWQQPPMPPPQPPAEQPSRATTAILLVGLVIVSVLVMATLVVAVLASRR